MQFNNNMPIELTHCKAQISKIIQSEECLGSLLSKLAGLLMKVAVPLAKNILIPLELTAAASTIHAGIQKKMQGSGTNNFKLKFLISNKEMNDIMKIVQALEDSNILLKGVTKTTKNETKEQKGGFLSMLLGTSGASLLGNMLAGNCKSWLWRLKRKMNFKSWVWKRMGSLIPPHLLSIIKMNQDLMVFILKTICLRKERMGLM